MLFKRQCIERGFMDMSGIDSKNAQTQNNNSETTQNTQFCTAQ